jgi:hypothetical protein
MLLRIDDPVKPVARPRDEQRELTRGSGSAASNGVQQDVVSGRTAGDDKHAFHVRVTSGGTREFHQNFLDFLIHVFFVRRAR